MLKNTLIFIAIMTLVASGAWALAIVTTMNFETCTICTTLGWLQGSGSSGTLSYGTTTSGNGANGTNQCAWAHIDPPAFGKYTYEYTTFAYVTTHDIRFTYWTYIPDTAVTGDAYQMQLAGPGHAGFAQKVDAGRVFTAGGPVSGLWYGQITTPLIDPNVWHQCKWVITQTPTPGLDFYWDNMTTPISTANKPYIGGNFNDFDSVWIAAWNSVDWYFDELLVEDLTAATPTPTIAPGFGSVKPTQGILFTASGGTPPYTWSLSTTGLGTLDVTTGASVTFTAGSTTGTLDITVTDSAFQSDTVNIIISPTYAGIAEDRDQIIIQRKPLGELFE